MTKLIRSLLVLLLASTNNMLAQPRIAFTRSEYGYTIDPGKWLALRLEKDGALHAKVVHLVGHPSDPYYTLIKEPGFDSDRTICLVRNFNQIIENDKYPTWIKNDKDFYLDPQKSSRYFVEIVQSKTPYASCFVRVVDRNFSFSQIVIETVDPTSYHEILWVGDINRDNIPDFIASHDELGFDRFYDAEKIENMSGGSYTRLFILLSSKESMNWIKYDGDGYQSE